MKVLKIYESKDLNGLTGENGEKNCVFIRDTKNPLNSYWSWVHTDKEANDLVERMKSQ